MTKLIHSPMFWVTLMYIYNSAVSTMPPLPEGASYWARWAYGAVHALAANWDKVMAMRNGAQTQTTPPPPPKV